MHRVRTSTEIKSIRKYQAEVIELNNTITKLKNTLEGFNSRLGETKEWIGKLEYKALELTQKQQQNFFKNQK